MDQIKILKRALNITLNYRVLWIFGILLALTSGGGGNGGSGNGGTKFNGDGNSFNGKNPFGELPNLTPEITNTIIGVLIAFACILLILMVVGAIARYISETALIRMVDRHENDDEKLTFREGFRLGWSRAAWKMFVMDFLTGLVVLIVFLAALMVAASPLLAWLTKSTPLQVLGTIVSVGLILLLVFATILVSLAMSLVLLFARRAIALEETGVIESIRRGYDILRARLVDILLMGVIMFGVGILWALMMIPVFLAVFLVAAVIAGLPALLVGGIAGLFTQGATPWIVAAVVGVPIFFVVVIIPCALVQGWMEVFSSSTWTLTYREALALAQANGDHDSDELPAPEAA